MARRRRPINRRGDAGTAPPPRGRLACTDSVVTVEQWRGSLRYGARVRGQGCTRASSDHTNSVVAARIEMFSSHAATQNQSRSVASSPLCRDAFSRRSSSCSSVATSTVTITPSVQRRRPYAVSAYRSSGAAVPAATAS
jgi:hypothetical protein